MPEFNQKVRVRMYRQGLGDCFLLRFLRADGSFYHVVIDSGVILGTASPGVVMREVALDIQNETDGRIDLLVVTHEHWDHVSGFTQAKDVWEQMDIQTVWLSWTEDPKSKLALRLRAEKQDKLNAVRAAIAGAREFSVDGSRKRRIEELFSFMGGLAADGDGATKVALDYIASRARTKVFCRPKDAPRTLADVPGVRVYSLGPPEDEKLIHRSDPSKAHPETYEEGAGFSAAAFTGERGDEDPFATQLKLGFTTAKTRRFFREHYGFDNGEDHGAAWRRLDAGSLAEAERLALGLDGDTNNTSLALAFEFVDTGKVLLFAADAQVGNWITWADLRWKLGTKSVTGKDLLARTVLYKVGHHGSHNATLREQGLELMTSRELMALVPVNLAMAQKKKWRMPFPPLYDRLRDKTGGRTILSDATEAVPSGGALSKLTAKERATFQKTVTAKPLYIDIQL